MANTANHPQIRVSALTKEELRRLGEKGESFDDIIRRLIVVYNRAVNLLEAEDRRLEAGEGAPQ